MVRKSQYEQLNRFHSHRTKEKSNGKEKEIISMNVENTGDNVAWSVCVSDEDTFALSEKENLLFFHT